MWNNTENKIKILQFPIANTYGGITHYALENWKWMDKKQFHCDFATMSKELSFEEDILKTGSKVHYISCYAEDNEKQFEKEVNKILDEGYDVVHLHTKQWKSFLVEELCIKHNIPRVIIHSHSTSIEVSDNKRRKEEELLHKKVKANFNLSLATDFWACSKQAADFLFGEQIPKKKIKIMPNAIDIQKFSYDENKRLEMRSKLGVEGKFVIGHVGRFSYAKNHEFLIDVFAEVEKQIPDSRLLLIGSGELFGQVQNKVENLGIKDKVLFVGKKNNVHDWYQAMDVFCLPSRFEGFPISVIEALASGLFAITSTFVTEEIMICDKVKRLPNDKKEWMKEILAIKGSERNDNKGQLISYGFDIRHQIKVIEREYM